MDFVSYYIYNQQRLTLAQYIIHLTPIPPTKAEQIAAYFQQEAFENGHLLVQEGKTSRKSYFLQSGIIRCFLVDREGEEITTRFFAAPDFLNDFQSFFKQKPSEENYQTLTPCEVWSIDLEQVQYCFHNIPEFREWGRMMLTMNYVTLHQQMIAFHKYDAKERYLMLLDTKPELINQVPLKYIASYLGITKYSLSRIRKEITES